MTWHWPAMSSCLSTVPKSHPQVSCDVWLIILCGSVFFFSFSFFTVSLTPQAVNMAGRTNINGIIIPPIAATDALLLERERQLENDAAASTPCGSEEKNLSAKGVNSYHSFRFAFTPYPKYLSSQ